MAATATPFPINNPACEDDESRNEHLLFSYLSNDVGLQCLARVPRSYYRSLSSVCKLWQREIHSQTLYSTRKSLSIIDFSLCLNLCLPNPDNNNPNASRKADHTLKWYELFPSSSNSTATRELFEILSPPAQPIGASIVSVGSKIYVIGGSIFTEATRTMWVYDLVSHKWELMMERQMGVARKYAAAAVVNGKIYLMGGCPVTKTARMPNWAEVFDPDTGLWSQLPSPCPGWEREGIILADLACAAVVVDGKIMCSTEGMGGLVFDTGSGEWGQLESKHDMGCRQNDTVVIGKVFYSSDYYLGEIWGYDFSRNEWKEVREEVEGEFPTFLPVVKMANMGRKLVVLWKETEKGDYTKDVGMEFHAAVIEIRQDEDGELWGSIDWTSVVGNAPSGSYILDCVVVGL